MTPFYLAWWRTDTVADAGTGDVVQLGAGLIPSNVALERNLNDLVVNLNGTSDRLILTSFSGAVPIG